VTEETNEADEEAFDNPVRRSLQAFRTMYISKKYTFSSVKFLKTSYGITFQQNFLANDPMGALQN
jgi:hypothetical protein